MYRLGTVSIKILGGLNRFYGYPTSPSASIMAQNIQLFGPREGFLTHQWIITENKSITDKYYDEAKMRTRQKRVATDTWRSLGCRTTPLEHWGKRKPTVEPRCAVSFVNRLNQTGSAVFYLRFPKDHLFRLLIGDRKIPNRESCVQFGNEAWIPMIDSFSHIV